MKTLSYPIFPNNLTVPIKQIMNSFYKSYPSACKGPSNEQDILNAENTLNLKFSPEYIAYLKKYGGGSLLDLNISGVTEIISMGSRIMPVFEKTNFYRSQGWPGIGDWYIVSDDGFGNPIGIDPEGKVWLSDHDSGFEKVKLSDSFDEFLYKVLTETLYE